MPEADAYQKGRAGIKTIKLVLWVGGGGVKASGTNGISAAGSSAVNKA